MENEQPKGYIVQEETAEELHIRECIYADAESLQHMLQHFAQEERTVYVDLDTEAQVEGRSKLETCMMVKQLQEQS
ncbi:GNAT family N-acetyltransferase, partial [Erysipelatoclostridium ramosum]|nr:GNAT family N-acetyltransferase [Thomasclavelia ramosa]